MLASYDECVGFLRGEIENVDSRELEEKDSAHYLRRNLAFAGWMLQKNFGSIDRRRLLALMGPSIEAQASFVVKIDFERFTQTSTAASLRFTDNMMRAVEDVFNEPESKYRILEPIPFFDGTVIHPRDNSILGHEFIEYMNLIVEVDQVALTELVAKAFVNALEGVTTSIPHDRYPHVRLVSSPEWSFLVSVYPSEGAITTDLINHATAIITFVRDYLRENEGLDQIHALLVAPAIDNEEDDHFLAEFPRIHHMWSMGTVRLFHRLEPLLKDWENATQHFMAFFPPDGRRFSTSEAKKRLEEKKN